MAKGIPVHVEGSVRIRGRPYTTQYAEILQIGTALAYASGDAFGGKFLIDVPHQGYIQTVIMYDLDDEGIETEVWLFRDDFTATADNAAFAVSDADLIKVVAVISISAFANAASNQLGIKNGLNYPYNAPQGKWWCQCVTRGAPNIAADNIPGIVFVIEDCDDPVDI